MTATELATGIARYLPPPTKCASVPHRMLAQLVDMATGPPRCQATSPGGSTCAMLEPHSGDHIAADGRRWQR